MGLFDNGNFDPLNVLDLMVMEELLDEDDEYDEDFKYDEWDEDEEDNDF